MFQILFPFKAIQGKEVFSKFCDSVLAKTSKVRGLIADLNKNYKNCPTAQKYHYVNSTFLFLPLYSQQSKAPRVKDFQLPIIKLIR